MANPSGLDVPFPDVLWTSSISVLESVQRRDGTAFPATAGLVLSSRRCRDLDWSRSKGYLARFRRALGWGRAEQTTCTSDAATRYHVIPTCPHQQDDAICLGHWDDASVECRTDAVALAFPIPLPEVADVCHAVRIVLVADP